MLRTFSSKDPFKSTSFLNVQGAIVMLYHPCAPKELVDELRKIVVGCLRNQSINQSKKNFNLPLLIPQKAYNCTKHPVHEQEASTDAGCLALQARSNIFKLKVSCLLKVHMLKIFAQTDHGNSQQERGERQ